MKIFKNNKLLLILLPIFFSIILVHFYFYAQSFSDLKHVNDALRNMTFLGRPGEAKAELLGLTSDKPTSNLDNDYLIDSAEQNWPSVSGKKEEHLYDQMIVQTASRHQIDPALVKAIIMAESGYNTRAISKKGAKGLMQLMPGTAQALGVEDIFDPHENVSGGVRYFKQLVDLFDGDVKLALAAYNAGSKNVRRYNGIPPFRVTRHYIKKVFKYKELFKKHMAEGVDSA